MAGVVVLLALAAVVAVPIAFSQMGKGQPVVYTFVSRFQVPRANWAQYSENTEKTLVPVAEKMVADGTILGYSTFESIVHTPEGYTHGAAWTSTLWATFPVVQCLKETSLRDKSRPAT